MELGLRTNSHPLIINFILAPHNAREENEKQKFWKQITKETNGHRNAIHITLGDTNVRWHCKRSGEEDHLGPFVYGRGEEFLDSHEKDGDNRGFCL